MKRLFSTILFLIALLPAFAQSRSLQYFLDQGMQHSPLLNDLRNQVRRNAIDSLRLRAAYKPQLNGISTNSYAPVIHGYGYDEALSNIGNFSELLAVSKQLAGNANRQNQYDAFRLANDSLYLSHQIAEQDLLRTITEQYLAAYGSWQQYLFNKEVNDLLMAEDTLLKKLARESVYRQTDYIAFLVTLKQQQVAVTQARMQFRKDYALLNYACGIFDSSFTALSNPDLRLDKLPDIDQSVYFRKFVVDSLILENRDARIDFDYKPRISLYADAGYMSSLQYLPYRNFGASLGFSIVVPLYDGRQRQMQHDQVAIDQETRQHYRDFFSRQYHQQIAQLHDELQMSQQTIDEAQNQLKFSRGLIEANGKLLVTGDVRMADYILSINNYLYAQNVITVSTVRKWQIINQLNYWNK